MRLKTSLLPILIVGALVIFAIENWSPAVPLVILGIETVALPLALWVIAAGLSGALTTLAIALCLNLLLNRSSRSAHSDSRPVEPSMDTGTYRQPEYASSSRSRSDYGFDDADAAPPRQSYPSSSTSNSTPRGSSARSSRATPESSPSSTAPSPTEDWEEFSRPRQEWEDWRRSTPGSTSSSTASSSSSERSTPFPSPSAASSWFSRSRQQEDPLVEEVEFDTPMSSGSRFAAPSDDSSRRDSGRESDRSASYTSASPSYDYEDEPEDNSYSAYDSYGNDGDVEGTGDYDHYATERGGDAPRYRDANRDFSRSTTQGPAVNDNDYRRDEYSRDQYGYDDYGRDEYSRDEYERSDYSRSDYDRPDYSRQDRDTYSYSDDSAQTQADDGASYRDDWREDRGSSGYDDDEAYDGAYEDTRYSSPPYDSSTAPNQDEQFIMDYGDEAALDAFEQELKTPSSGRYRWKNPFSKRKSTPGEFNPDDPNQTSTQATQDDLDLDDLDEWDDWEDDASASSQSSTSSAHADSQRGQEPDSSSDETPRPIREVQQRPISTQQSGSVYSYRYRSDEDDEGDSDN